MSLAIQLAVATAMFHMIACTQTAAVNNIENIIEVTMETPTFKGKLEPYDPKVPPISKYFGNMCSPNGTSPVNLTVTVASAAAGAGEIKIRMSDSFRMISSFT